MLFATSDGNGLALLIVLFGLGVMVKGIAKAVCSSSLPSTAAKHGTMYLLRQLFR